MSFGSELRQQRESRGITLEQIAASTRFSERHLRALESDTYSELPGGVFNRGIVRGYCHVVELDPDLWTAHFMAEHAHQTAERDWTEFAENVKSTRTTTHSARNRWLGVLAMVLLLLALMAAAWHFILRGKLAHRQPSAPAAHALCDFRPLCRFSVDIA